MLFVLQIILIFVLISSPTFVIPLAIPMPISEATEVGKSTKEIVEALLTRVRIIDGHNDFPMNLRSLAMNDLTLVKFDSDLKLDSVWSKAITSRTDLRRLRAGHVGGQFWSAYVNCTTQYKEAVVQTIEQIDVIKRLIEAYSNDLQLATSTQEIEDAMSKGKIASLIGVEGGHSIQSNYGVLRMFYDLGARYMTLTHNCHTPWADSALADSKGQDMIPALHNGLNKFGLGIVDEMNRLGMMVDLSHTSAKTMRDALKRSKAPVIFSHSGSRKVSNHYRNVPEDVLKLVKSTNSLVMVNFFSGYARVDKEATLDDIVSHVDHIKNMTSSFNVGIGGDYDGVDKFPVGLEDVSKFPNLFEALYNTGRWTEEDLENLASKNLLRVFAEIEKVGIKLRAEGMTPIQTPMKVNRRFLVKQNVSSCIDEPFF